MSSVFNYTNEAHFNENDKETKLTTIRLGRGGLYISFNTKTATDLN